MKMDDLIAIASLWLAHVVIAGVVVVPVVWFTRRRVQWRWWQLAVFIVPFGVWFALLYAGWRPKTLANLGECFMISGAIVVAAIAQGLFFEGQEAALCQQCSLRRLSRRAWMLSSDTNVAGVNAWRRVFRQRFPARKAGRVPAGGFEPMLGTERYQGRVASDLLPAFADILFLSVSV